MIRRLRRWWYRKLRLDEEAREYLGYALFASACGDDKAFDLWHEAYGEIYEICNEICNDGDRMRTIEAIVNQRLSLVREADSDGDAD